MAEKYPRVAIHGNGSAKVLPPRMAFRYSYTLIRYPRVVFWDLWGGRMCIQNFPFKEGN